MTELSLVEQAAASVAPRVPGPPKPKRAAREPSLNREKFKSANDFMKLSMIRFLKARDKKTGKRRIYSIFETLYKNASNDRSPQSKASAELMFAYGFDKPKPAPDELDAMAKSGFQVVYVERGGLEDVPHEPALPPAPEPKFIAGEFTEDTDV